MTVTLELPSTPKKVFARTSTPGFSTGSAVAPATDLSGVLQTRFVHVDSTEITAVFSIRGAETLGTKTAPRDVVLKIEGETAVRKDCSRSPTKCVITARVSNTTVFQDLGTNSAAVHLAVQFGFAGDVLQSFDAGVAVNAEPEQLDAALSGVGVNTISATLPFYPLHGNDEFKVPIHSQFDVFLDTWSTLLIKVDLNYIQFVRFEWDQSKLTISQGGSGNVRNLGLKERLKSGAASPKGELLLTAVFKAVPQASSGTLQSSTIKITLEPGGITSASGQLQPSQPSWLRSRDGVSGSGSALLYFATDLDKTLGILPYADGPAEMLNVAVLKNSRLAALDVPIKAVVVRPYRVDHVDSLLSCGYTDPADSEVLQLTGSGQCTVSLSGDEIRGTAPAFRTSEHRMQLFLQCVLN